MQVQNKIPERKSSVNLKLLIVGDASVGKTSLVSRFVNNKFQPLTTATVGVDFKVTKFEMPQDVIPKTNHDEKKVPERSASSSSLENEPKLESFMTEMYIWDPAGSEKYRQITQSFFSGVDAILVAFEISNRKSFESAKEWRQDIQNFLSQSPGKNVKLILVGTKVDLEDSRQVEFSSAYTYAMENKMNYFECSAATGKGVQDIFHHLAFHILNHTNKQQKRVESFKKPHSKAPATEPNLNHPEMAGCCTIL